MPMADVKKRITEIKLVLEDIQTQIAFSPYQNTQTGMMRDLMSKINKQVKEGSNNAGSKVSG